jgi:surface protein
VSKHFKKYLAPVVSALTALAFASFSPLTAAANDPSQDELKFKINTALYVAEAGEPSNATLDLYFENESGNDFIFGEEFIIDWGDGQSTTVTPSGSSVSITKDYGAVPSSDTFYTVSIKIYPSQLMELGYGDPSENVNTGNEMITEVLEFHYGIIDYSFAFSGASNLLSVPATLPSDNSFPIVKNLDSMFLGASSFNSDISGWDTSKVTDMGTMFEGASSFNQYIGKWDTGSVTNMSDMLKNASSYNYCLPSTFFLAGESFVDIGISSSGFEDSCLANPSQEALVLKLDLSKYDDSNSDYPSDVGFELKFNGLQAGQSLTINWDDGLAAETITADGVNFKDYGFTAPFSRDIRKITVTASDPSVRVSFGGDTSAGETIGNEMVIEAIEFPVWIEDYSSSFAYAKNLIFVPPTLPAVGGVPVVKNLKEMFFRAELFNSDVSQWDTSQVTDMSETFEDAENFNRDIGDWDTSKVETMDEMFQGAEVFNKDISGWDTSSLTDMGEMFEEALAFNQPIGNWDTSGVTDMNDLFRLAQNFNEPIGNWNTSLVESMQEMFDGASSFNQDIGNWNTSAVKRMDYMFFQASAFNQYIGNWDTSSINTSMTDMFAGATAYNYCLPDSFFYDQDSYSTLGITTQGFADTCDPNPNSETVSAPAPYSGPVITSVGSGSAINASSTETIRVSGERLGSVSGVLVDGKQGTVVSVATDHFMMTLPEGLGSGTYDLVIQSSIGNLTYLDAIKINTRTEIETETVQEAEYGLVSAWTKRISDGQVKVYVKFPTVGEKVRISHQTGGAGSYESVYVRTTSSETMEGLRIVEGVGTYIVRTIDLEGINRIRVTVGDQTLVQVRYNN